MGSKKKAAPPARKRGGLTFDQWKARAAIYLDEQLAIRDGFDLDDPYDLKQAAQKSFEVGTSPEAFINIIFAEDFARQEADGVDLEQSIEQEFDEDQDPDDW